jgi:hypothetical protein
LVLFDYYNQISPSFFWLLKSEKIDQFNLSHGIPFIVNYNIKYKMPESTSAPASVSLAITLEIDSIHDLVKKFMSNDYFFDYFEGDVLQLRQFVSKKSLPEFSPGVDTIQTTAIERSIMKLIKTYKIEDYIVDCFDSKTMTFNKYIFKPSFKAFLEYGTKTITHIVTDKSSIGEMANRCYFEREYGVQKAGCLNLFDGSIDKDIVKARFAADIAKGFDFNIILKDIASYKDKCKTFFVLDVAKTYFEENKMDDMLELILKEINRIENYNYIEIRNNPKTHKFLITKETVNRPYEKGSYFVHYFAQIDIFEMVQYCIELGATMFEENGTLIKGDLDYNIFQWADYKRTDHELSDKLFGKLKLFYETINDTESAGKIKAEYELYIKKYKLYRLFRLSEKSEINKMLNEGIELYSLKYIPDRTSDLELVEKKCFMLNGNNLENYITGSFGIYKVLCEYYTKQNRTECIELLKSMAGLN